MSTDLCLAELELERLRQRASDGVKDESYFAQERFFQIIIAREKELGPKGRDSFLYYSPLQDADVPFDGDAECRRKTFFQPPDRWLGATSASSHRSRSAPAESRPRSETARASDSVVSRPRSEAAQSEAPPPRPPKQEYWKCEDCGGEADAPPPPPPRAPGVKSHKCEDCRGWFMASEVMIDVDVKDVGYDWQGHLPKRCFACLQNGPGGPRWDMDEPQARKLFNKLSASKRKHRQYMLNEHVSKRARTISWQEALQDIEREHGLSTAEWRRVVADKAKEFAVRVLLAFGRSTPHEKHMMAKGFDRFTNNMKKAADDPDLVPKLEFLFHDHAADFLEEITEGINDHYLCRRKGCNFVGPNTHWIISSTGGQFRCPDCGERYQPWRSVEDKNNDTFIPAQKILIFSRLDDADCRLLSKALLKDYVSMPVKRDVSMVLTLWPDTITQNLINEFNQLCV